MTQAGIPSHSPQGTLLHWVVLTFYQQWLAYRKAKFRPATRIVRREFERFLLCGDPSSGYAILGCDPCEYMLGIAASCKGRAWCPYCLSRRRARHIPHLVDGLLGRVPVRHWVLCLPPHLRYTLGYDPAMLSATLNAFVDSIFRYLKWKAKRELGVRSVKLVYPASVSFIHRCSANVDTNVHFHCLVPDGVFIQQRRGGPVQFHALTFPSDAAIEAVALDACRRTCRALERRKHWRWTGSRSSATVEGLFTFGDRRDQPAKFFGQASRHGEGGVAPRDGAYAFHVYADHLVEAGNRRGLEDLVRYVLAPPVIDAQLTMDAMGNIVIRMKRARHDGTDEEVVAPMAFLDRMAALVGRPRSNAIRFHGAYAPNATIRDDVVGWATISVDAEQDEVRQALRVLHARCHPPEHPVCPHCLGRLTLAEVVTPRFRYRKAGWIPPDGRSTQRVQDRNGQVHGTT